MKIIDFVAVASSALTAGGASVGSLALFGESVTSLAISVACAGSASAVIFSAVNGESENPKTLYRQMVLSFSMFVIGSLFGLFMAGTLTKLPLLDDIGALYLGGLIGYAVVGVLLSSEMRHGLTEWVKGWFK